MTNDSLIEKLEIARAQAERDPKKLGEFSREIGTWNRAIALVRQHQAEQLQGNPSVVSVKKCDHEKTFHHPYLTNAQLDDIHERMNHEVSREEICKIADHLETRHLLITQRHIEPVSVDLEAAAKAIYDTMNVGERWDGKPEFRKAGYRTQAKACAEAWGLKWK